MKVGVKKWERNMKVESMLSHYAAFFLKKGAGDRRGQGWLD